MYFYFLFFSFLTADFSASSTRGDDGYQQRSPTAAHPIWKSNAVSGKPNRCEYEQLSAVEGNNNRTDRNKKNGKNKNERHRRFGSIDNEGNENDDESSASSQEDEDSGNQKRIRSFKAAPLLLLLSLCRLFARHFDTS